MKDLSCLAPTAPNRYEGNREPSLREIFADPVFLALLRRDGLTVADVCAQLGFTWCPPRDDMYTAGQTALAA